jgi:hypothetical protein
VHILAALYFLALAAAACAGLWSMARKDRDVIRAALAFPNVRQDAAQQQPRGAFSAAVGRA